MVYNGWCPVPQAKASDILAFTTPLAFMYIFTLKNKIQIYTFKSL